MLSIHAKLMQYGFLSTLFLLGAALLLAPSPAQAQQTYRMTTGVWARSDGGEVDVPFFGASPANCDFIVQGRRNTIPVSMTMNPPPLGTMNTGLKAQNFGCPAITQPTAPLVTATAAGVGGAFTVPTNIFKRPAPANLVAVSIPLALNLIQAATDAEFRGPDATVGQSYLTSMGYEVMNAPGGTYFTTDGMGMNNLAPFRLFHRDAWQGGPAMTHNTQTGRSVADFTWCFGVGKCTGLPQATAGNKMTLQYKAGKNAFGGTMNHLMTTTTPGSIAISAASILFFNVLDAGMGAVQPTGRGFADYLTDALPPAMDAFDMFMTGQVYVPEVQAYQMLLTTVMCDGVCAVPPQFQVVNYNQKTGFPFTTGTVIARRTSPLQMDLFTLTAMGADTTTQQTTTTTSMGATSVMTNGMGIRNVSLVAGALANLSTATNNTVGMSQVFMPEPRRAGQLFAGVAGLLAVAAWRSRRRG